MQSKIKIFWALVLVLVAAACVKQKITTPSVGEFAAKDINYLATFYVPDAVTPVFKVPVGITNVSNKDRVLNFTVSSPSGATEGQQYTVGTTSITIPAGKVADSISVTGIFAGLAAGRVDTLIFTMTGGDVPLLTESAKYTLVLRQYCPVNLADLEGTYDNTFDDASYGPYTTELVAGTVTGTKATMTLINLWDFGFADIPITLDFTDPANFSISFKAQSTGIDAGPAVGPTYAGHTLWIYPLAGIFSSCDQTFVIRYQLGVPDMGVKFAAEFTELAR